MAAKLWVELHLQRDGSCVGAGDGTRTRDSLLGRQIVTKSPLASSRRALEEPSPIAHAIQAAQRQMVERGGRQMVICFPSHHTLVFSRMQARRKDVLSEPVWQRSDACQTPFVRKDSSCSQYRGYGLVFGAPLPSHVQSPLPTVFNMPLSLTT